jgi:integrase
MGSHLMRRPPKYVQGFIDRHGKPRFYFRRVGFKTVPLPGLPWSPGFMAAYEAASGALPAAVGQKRTRPGSMRALAVSYFNSVAFRSMRPSTQYERRGVIERFCREHGDKSAVGLQAKHVRKLIEAQADKPGAANALRKALRQMMQHAIEIELRPDDPTRDVKAVPIKSDGHHSWTEDEIEQFQARHPAGRARLALALLLYTGQRRGDVVRMGRQHIRDGEINIRQEKTNRMLAIQVHIALAEIIAETPRENLTFLMTRLGQPFTPNGFSKWFREQCDAAGLPKRCSAHGLRKAAARRLAEAGCSVHEIAAVTGHASLREVERYTSAASQRHLARAAMSKVKA